MLREHYRCHPKIINFCNQEFYDGKLIIMTKDRGEKDVLMAIMSLPSLYAHWRHKLITSKRTRFCNA
ncbi:AAA domain-containing protein [Segatella bryantii]|uniref:AAA domain-containing protein n=1 Tax=Segatella bryantii TaxID=77095 RepID=UPI00384EF8E6